jgi:hypothetical protein
MEDMEKTVRYRKYNNADYVDEKQCLKEKSVTIESQ